MRLRFSCTIGTLFMASALLITPQAPAATVDLTGGEGSSGTANGAIFEFFVLQPAGTGVLDPFVRLQDGGDEEGYNTSGRPVPFDEKTDPNFTRDLTFGEIPIVERDGTQYLEFLLDINEPNNANSLVSLEALQIYTSDSGGLTTTDLTSLGTLRFDLGDNNVLLDHSQAPGSGKTDMAALIPLALFEGADDSDFVYLYSAFTGSQAGFEEWAVRTSASPPEPGPGNGGQEPPIPTPAALPMGLALMAMLGLRRIAGRASHV